MQRNLYVLDLGNGDFKIGSTVHQEIITIPAVVGQLDSYSHIDFGVSGAKQDNMSLKKDDKDYAIGKMALKNSTIRNHDVTEDKYVSADTMILSHASFSLLSDSVFSFGNAIIGLPLHKMHMAKDIIRFYQSQQFGGIIGYFGQYENISRKVGLEQVLAVAQPHGTIFNLILDDNGQIADRELAKKGIAVFDIGFKTNDGVVFKNLEPIGRLSINSKNGTQVAYGNIARAISTRFDGLEIKLFEVPEIIRTGVIKGVSVKEIINDALYNLASNIILEVKSKWGDAWEIEKIVFTGGGAILLRPYLEQAFDAVYKDAKSNAEGMLKYAKRIWKEVK